MGIEKLKRVMWRLKEKNPTLKVILKHDLENAIMWECGTAYVTIFDNRAALIRLGWIKRQSRYFTVGNKYYEDETNI